MNNYLTRKIWEMRKNIVSPPDTLPVSLNKVAGKNYQLLFASCGCENACSFCNYGFDFKLTLEMVKPELDKIDLEKFDIDDLELEANGSFLSEREIPYDLFLYALQYVSNRGIPSITIETHYTTITEKKLKDIRKILGKEQAVNFELGFESAAEDVRAIYNKDIDIEEYLDVANLCEKYRIELLINVLLGAPFLTREKQIQDCLNSLDFIFQNMPKGTWPMLFPINIKENTMLRHWQKSGVYDQISSWEFVELLHRIPEEYLGSLNIAWWGNRENTFAKGITQSPRTCEKCNERLMNFYNDFYCSIDASYRKKITNEIWSTRCQCDT